MSAKLDTTRVNRDFKDYMSEIFQHLIELPGNQTSLTLDIQVHVPEGIPPSVIRTVTENCKTLQI